MNSACLSTLSYKILPSRSPSNISAFNIVFLTAIVMTVTYTQKVSDCKGFGSFWRLLFRTFEQLSLYCDYFRNLIPISFVLGFYVSVVVQRWWEQYLCIPWPDDFAIFCTAYIRGKEGPPKLLRATLLRYVNLTCAMTFSRISGKVKKKFPSYKSMLDAGKISYPHI
ncbi:bestrophin-3-like isoform X3 [Palaemon carinicauda]|uniref:bestrophin-3-like isoform X3 n=1 Tax=Palaemon carinicauda TaxID=392227 RepID=UPI0035B64F94